MREERLDWAAHTETRAKEMHALTGNPFYVIEAIAAARTAEWKVPEWALEILLASVRVAYFRAMRDEGDVSVDKALGINTKRGGTPVHRAAAKARIESEVFDLVRVVHHCYEVSIPEACEAVYSTIDYDFARSMDEFLPKRRDELSISDARLERVGISREEWLEIQRKSKERENKVIEAKENTEVVKQRLRNFDWWRITRGERLGYSLDTLIDRYYRDGSKRPVRSGKLEPSFYLLIEGQILSLVADRFTTRVPDYGSESVASCISLLRSFTPRKEFADLVSQFSAQTGAK